jgi:RNA polymerase sigma factor (sigma-70 family)
MEYRDLFWYVWQENEPELSRSIIKLAFIRRYQGDPQDVVQNVMLYAYSKWHEYDPSRSFKTWILWLAKSHIGNLYQLRRLEAVSIFQETEDGDELIEVIPVKGMTPEEVIIKKERRIQIWIAVSKLNPRQVAIVKTMLRLILENRKPTMRAVAERVGCSHTTVNGELVQIRQALQKTGLPL